MRLLRLFIFRCGHRGMPKNRHRFFSTVRPTLSFFDASRIGISKYLESILKLNSTFFEFRTVIVGPKLWIPFSLSRSPSSTKSRTSLGLSFISTKLPSSSREFAPMDLLATPMFCDVPSINDGLEVGDIVACLQRDGSILWILYELDVGLPPAPINHTVLISKNQRHFLM